MRISDWSSDVCSSALLLLTPFMAIVTFLATSLIAILLGALAYAAGMRQWAFTHWAVFMVRRFWARLFDHRVWIVGIGFLPFASSIILLMFLTPQFQPPINRENGNTECRERRGK